VTVCQGMNNPEVEDQIDESSGDRVEDVHFLFANTQTIAAVPAKLKMRT
jgi:hypothetical protein